MSSPQPPQLPDWGRSVSHEPIAGRVAIAGVGDAEHTKASGRSAHEIAAEAVERAIADGVRHAEIFFDAQTHTGRGIDIGTVIRGFTAAMEDFADRISTGLIMCFLRHLSPDEAVATFEAARPYLDLLIGVGLDSSELGRPPELFTAVFELARSAGLRITAHAGEEAGPDFVWGALDSLGAERIDHGIRAEEDDELVERLARDGIPLTMCPISNRKLQVFSDLSDHNLKRLMDRGVRVTINSDDPAYFGGYVAENYSQTARALGLNRSDIAQIARNSIEASFLDSDAKALLLGELDQYLAQATLGLRSAVTES